MKRRMQWEPQSRQVVWSKPAGQYQSQGGSVESDPTLSLLHPRDVQKDSPPADSAKGIRDVKQVAGSPGNIEQSLFHETPTRPRIPLELSPLPGHAICLHSIYPVTTFEPSKEPKLQQNKDPELE